MTLPTVESILQAEAGESGKLFRDLLRGILRQTLNDLIEEEVSGLCGPKYDPINGGSFYRSGNSPSSAYVLDRKEKISRPRVRERSESGTREVRLKTLEAARDPAEWEATMFRGILCGVSCRDQAPMHPDQISGMSPSSVSRLWNAKAGELIAEINEADLSGIPLLGLMIDGTVLAEGLHAIIALGIDLEGNKSVLGFVIGGSENTELCRALVNDLVRRGLKPSCKRLLAVLDGSKPLRNAVLSQWPDAVIQRCLVHKERNLYAYLPKRHHPKLKRLFARLRKAQGGKQADEIVEEMSGWLESINAQALKSLREAGEELTAFHHLNVPNTLNRTFLSTNHIENIMRNLKRHLGRVKRWREETDMAAKWVASGLCIARNGFRKIWNHAELGALRDALNNPSESRSGDLSHGAKKELGTSA